MEVEAARDVRLALSKVEASQRRIAHHAAALVQYLNEQELELSDLRAALNRVSSVRLVGDGSQ